MTKINLTVDGVTYTDEVEPRTLLVHYLREQVGKIGTVVGCDTSNCGACTVDLDGASVKSCTVLAVQADGGEVLTDRGPGRRRRHAAPGPDRVPRAARPAVRLLHAGHDHGGSRPAQEQPEPVRGRGARGHRGQPLPLHRLPEHRPSGPGRGRSKLMTAVDRRPQHADPRDRPVPQAQGGRAPHHRAHHLDRQHGPAGHAAPGDPAQPDGARDDHLHRHHRGEVAAGRRRRVHRPGLQGHPGRPALRVAGHPRHGQPGRAVAGGHAGQSRRRVRRRRRRPHQGRGAGRARGHRRRVRAAAGHPRHGGGDQGRLAARPPQHRVEPLLHLGLRVGRGRYRGADRRRRCPTPRSRSSAASSSSGSSPRSWSRARPWCSPSATACSSTRPPRSRTSCGRCSR